MKLINNSFGEITGFSMEDMLETKKKISNYKEKKIEESEFILFLKEKFPEKFLNFSSEYIKNLEILINSYLLNPEELIFSKIDDYFNLKSELLAEINIISNNLSNLKINTQNTIRILKNSQYLNDYFTKVSELFEKLTYFKKRIKNSLKKAPLHYEDSSFLWLESQKIKNFEFKMIKLPEILNIWEEFTSIYDYIKIESENYLEKSSKKKEHKLILDFFSLYNYIYKKENREHKFYSELLYFLYKNNLLLERQTQEFHNVVERKEIKKKLKIFLKPIVKESILDELKDIIKEIQNLNEDFHPKEKEAEIIDFDKLLKDKISHFLPILIDYYIRGFENYYQFKISEIEELNKIDENIRDYSEKMEFLYDKIKNIDKNTRNYGYFLNPFEEVLDSLRDLYNIYLDDILRRKEEFIEYLNANKNQKLKEEVKIFIASKIEELNKLINDYRDKTAIILSDKFTPLMQINDIISSYKLKIKEIKNTVSKKLNTFKEKDVDQYHIIKEWEENFNRRKQQIGFLLSQFLSKLYKDFGDLIRKEESLFEGITEISGSDSEEEDLPINYALSSYLAEKLTEEELRERIIELKAKINQLEQDEKLYNKELNHLETTLENKVKIREGIEVSNIQCGICRK
ncbi:MAG: hypothetical protein KGD57_03555, partial [Candidatus Lokiarchaeota archaeon]|nr:hypothetical protein [Candidatus Lokiarchaeota archaeon]